MVSGLDWQCCLAGSSKSITIGANYSFEVKNIEIWAPAFFKHNNSSVATVNRRPTFVNTYLSLINESFVYIVST